MASDKLYKGTGSGADQVGPHTDVVRKRVLGALAVGGNGAQLFSVGPHTHGLGAVQTVVALVPVQQAYPGRRCQACDVGPEMQLATRTRPSSTGQGRDFFCQWHAPGGCDTEVPMRVAVAEGVEDA